MTKEGPPATVQNAKQAGEARSRWEWVEPSVGTDRMLVALSKHGLFSTVAARAQAIQSSRR